MFRALKNTESLAFKLLALAHWPWYHGVLSLANHHRLATSHTLRVACLYTYHKSHVTCKIQQITAAQSEQQHLHTAHVRMSSSRRKGRSKDDTSEHDQKELGKHVAKAADEIRYKLSQI